MKNNNTDNNYTSGSDKKSVLVITLLSAFLMPFMGSSINIALPSIGKEFGIDAILLSWIATAFLLSVAVFLVPFGKIADMYGRKKVFIYGTLIYTLASLLAGFASSATELISLRVLQGIGSAMFSATGIAILISIFPKEERGKVLGINVAAVYLGLSLGPFIGGIITQHLGWRYIFLLNAPLSLIIMLLSFWKLHGELTEAKGGRFDLVGSLSYSLVLIALMYGLSLLPAMTGAGFILKSVLGFWLFVRWETRTINPLLNINLFRSNTVFVFSNLAALINYSATSAVSFLLSLYLQYIKGISPQYAGLILVAQPVVMAIFSPFAGRLSDRIEPRIVASTGMALTMIGLFILTFLGQNTDLWFIIISLIILGSGFALFSSPNTNAVMSSVDKKVYGIASATLGTMRLVGQMFSMGITMMLFSVYIGRVKITPENYPVFLISVKATFLICAMICLIGIFFSLARGKVR